ncbi:hypothetical protein QAD02_008113 [Eretmocerus hayati]|uniref:Uncharacterized protein n=1 Tax=Eretmocerus hayati TaxID=131215 RepID=A0ACC2N6D2_9HYME|nr:hypothetical protein QAD02_008113 [Eretmocerus hayati]
MEAPGDLVTVHSYKWVIRNFSNLPNTVGNPVKSPTLELNGHRFELEIYPGGIDIESRSHVSPFLRLKSTEPVEVDFKISIVQDDLKRIFYQERTDSVDRAGDRRFARLMSLENALRLANDALTIVCDIFDIVASIKNNKLEISGGLENYFNEETFSDVTVSIGGKSIKAHKLILASKSKVFHTMLLTNMKERNEGLIKIDDLSYETMFVLIKWMYTGCTDLDSMRNLAEDLVVAADRYEICQLKADCEDYLISNLDAQNILEYLIFAERLNAHKLRKAGVVKLVAIGKQIKCTPRYHEFLREISSELYLEIAQAEQMRGEWIHTNKIKTFCV